MSMAVREQLLPFLRQRRQSLSVQFLVYVFAFALLPGLARCAVDNNDSTTPLHILYITSSGGGYDSSGTRPAVDMAIERINNDTAVLPEYTLNVTEADSQVSIKWFDKILGRPNFRSWYYKPPKLLMSFTMIFGGIFSHTLYQVIILQPREIFLHFAEHYSLQVTCVKSYYL